VHYVFTVSLLANPRSTESQTASGGWLGDLCSVQNLPFLLGHALSLKAIHGGKTKTDRIDSEKLATLLRGGNFPVSYVHPAALRNTRDLLRRRATIVRRRSATITHVQMAGRFSDRGISRICRRLKSPSAIEPTGSVWPSTFPRAVRSLQQNVWMVLKSNCQPLDAIREKLSDLALAAPHFRRRFRSRLGL